MDKRHHDTSGVRLGTLRRVMTELLSCRGGCTFCLPCCERICERNAAQLPRWRETRREALDTVAAVTCAKETDEASRDADRLDIPEVAGSNLSPLPGKTAPGELSGGRFHARWEHYWER